VLVDGEVVAVDHEGTPNFAALQAALSEGRTQDLIYFAFDLMLPTERIYDRCLCRTARTD